jgi:hypothetical protein
MPQAYFQKPGSDPGLRMVKLAKILPTGWPASGLTGTLALFLNPAEKAAHD